MKCLGIISAVLSFVLCMAGGVWILVNSGFDRNDPLGAGLGLYFMGKALFVGPMLIFASMQLGEKKNK